MIEHQISSIKNVIPLNSGEKTYDNVKVAELRHKSVIKQNLKELTWIATGIDNKNEEVLN